MNQPNKKQKFATFAVITVIFIILLLGLLVLLPRKKTNLGQKTNDTPFSNLAESILGPLKEIGENSAKNENGNNSLQDNTQKENRLAYPLHSNITATIFWIGEDASDDNQDISNVPSAWDEDWKEHYGGVDDPDKRNGFYPARFTPRENPFYLALPYNDFDINGNRRGNSQGIYWAKEKKWADDESMVKNRWVKIIHNGKACYGQWEDVGPFKENDFEYVFGKNQPKSRTNKSAGIDVSPAIKDCLDLEDLDRVDWQFVDFDDVPDGPWKKIITTSDITWH